MSLGKPLRHSASFGKHLVAALALAAGANACSLSDYSYLGAKRDGDTSKHAGGAQTSTTPSGGTAGQGGQLSGGTHAGSSTPTSSAGGNSSQGGVSASTNGGMTASGGTPATSNFAGGVPSNAGATSTAKTSAVAGGGSTSGGGAAAAGTRATNGGTTHTVGGSPSGGTGGTTVTTTATPPPSSCDGCAVLEVPFTGINQTARYFMVFTPSVTVNTRVGGTSGAVTAAGTLKVRVFAPVLGNRQYQLLVQRSVANYEMCFSEYRSLPASVTAEWVTLEWNLQSCASDTDIGRIGLDLRTSDATTDPTPGDTEMWVDSIWIERDQSVLVGAFDFDAATSVNATPVQDDWNQTPGVLYYRPSVPPSDIEPPTGTTISWRND